MPVARRWAAVFSVAVHGVLAVLLFALAPETPAPPVEVAAMGVSLVSLPPRPPPPSPPVAKRSVSPTAATAVTRVPKIMGQVPVSVTPLLALEGPTTFASELGEGDLVGAVTVGASDGLDTGCNLPARLQRALRRDGRVRAAVSEMDRGRALRIWDGDWVRHPGQEGAGLAAVREAIVWEVGFAPEACRGEPIRGIIVLSLSDSPGAARLAIGGGSWRWTDLLFARSSTVRR